MNRGVITEGDIFKTIVADNMEITHEDLINNMRAIVNRIPVNIFTDEYAIIYNGVRWCKNNGLELSQNVLQQLMINSADSILDSGKITLHLDKQDSDERMGAIITDTLVLYNSLSFEEVDSTKLQGHMNLYIESWYHEEVKQLVYEMSLILENGYKVGRKVYKGAEMANEYYKEKMSLLISILNERQDYLADDIDTTEDTGLDLQERIGEDEGSAENLCTLGIKSLDEELGGLVRKELVLVKAGSGVGKTRMTVGNIGYNALMEGHNVLHISLEQVPTRVMPMYVARHIYEKHGTVEGMSDKDFIRKTYPQDKESIYQEAIVDLTENPKYGKLKIVGRDLKADELMDYLDEVYDTFKFDVVILDYFGLLQTSTGGMYTEYRQAASQLKSACKYFRGVGFLAVVVAQISKEAETKMREGNLDYSKLGGSDTSELLRGADISFTLYDNEEMRAMMQMKLIVDKVRLGNLNDVDLTVDKARCVFVEDFSEEDDY